MRRSRVLLFAVAALCCALTVLRVWGGIKYATLLHAVTAPFVSVETHAESSVIIVGSGPVSAFVAHTLAEKRLGTVELVLRNNSQSIDEALASMPFFSCARDKKVLLALAARHVKHKAVTFPSHVAVSDALLKQARSSSNNRMRALRMHLDTDSAPTDALSALVHAQVQGLLKYLLQASHAPAASSSRKVVDMLRAFAARDFMRTAYLPLLNALSKVWLGAPLDTLQMLDLRGISAHSSGAASDSATASSSVAAAHPRQQICLVESASAPLFPLPESARVTHLGADERVTISTPSPSSADDDSAAGLHVRLGSRSPRVATHVMSDADDALVALGASTGTERRRRQRSPDDQPLVRIVVQFQAADAPWPDDMHSIVCAECLFSDAFLSTDTRAQMHTTVAYIRGVEADSWHAKPHRVIVDHYLKQLTAIIGDAVGSAVILTPVAQRVDVFFKSARDTNAVQRSGPHVFSLRDFVDLADAVSLRAFRSAFSAAADILSDVASSSSSSSTDVASSSSSNA